MAVADFAAVMRAGLTRDDPFVPILSAKAIPGDQFATRLGFRHVIHGDSSIANETFGLPAGWRQTRHFHRLNECDVIRIDEQVRHENAVHRRKNLGFRPPP